MALLFHGHATAKDSLPDPAKEFHRLGRDVLLVDFHGSGGSVGATAGVPGRAAVRLLDGFAHAPCKHARRGKCRVLQMHGANDPRVSMTEAKRVFDALAGEKRRMAFNDAGHESYLAAEPDAWRKSAAAFLSEKAGRTEPAKTRGAAPRGRRHNSQPEVKALARVLPLVTPP